MSNLPEPEAFASILIVATLPEELDHSGVLHTGVSKLNAAHALTRERQRPRLVVNYGTEGVVCGSGDRFVTAVDPWLLHHGVEVVDMELSAIASVCQREGLPWRAFKFISNHADRDSETSWQAHVQGGQALFLERLAQLAKDV